MRLKDKCRSQRAEIERLWKMVEWPPKTKIEKGGILIASKAFCVSELMRAYSSESIIDAELSDLRQSILEKLKGARAKQALEGGEK